jgi:hypothetical protein
MDTSFNITKQYELLDKSNFNTIKDGKIVGLEDLMLFEYNSELWFTCTTLDTNVNKLPQISLCKLSKNNVDNYEVIEKSPIISPNNRAEKNWLPIIINNNIHFMYSYHPFIIKKYIEPYYTQDFISTKYDLDFSTFKGSAAPIQFDMEEKGYLFIIHESFNLTRVLRCYINRFIWMDSNYKIKKMSHPWYFHHHGIEFCRGLCYSHNINELILTYSIHDKDAQMCTININYIKSLLFDLDYFNL